MTSIAACTALRAIANDINVIPTLDDNKFEVDLFSPKTVFHLTEQRAHT